MNELILKLRPRPLRLAYLVSSTIDITNAAKLYSHMWGGFSNTIFPISSNDEQLKHLKCALISFNPDYIIVPEECNPDLISQLNQLPSQCLTLSLSRIESIVNQNKSLCFSISTLYNSRIFEFPHVYRVLRSLNPNSSYIRNTCLIHSNPIFESVSLLGFGEASIPYQAYLNNNLESRSILISSIEDFLKLSLMGGLKIIQTPISLTCTEVRYSSQSWNLQNHDKVFSIFLYGSGDLNIACNFWNSRRLDLGYSNKIILPKIEFVRDLKRCILILSGFFPSMSELQIQTTTSSDDAQILANEINDIFSAINRTISVKVFYEENAYVIDSGRVYSGKAVISTRQILSADKSINFSPIVPSGYEDSDCIFGYDAEIKFSSGKPFSIPYTQFCSILLSNRIELVEDAECSKGYHFGDPLQQKAQPVRPDDRGITGIAISNEECHIYIPESKEVVRRWLKNIGYSFKPNDHTRYAEGFIKRFGGFHNIKRLVNQSGIKIFFALGSDGAKQSGFEYARIQGYFDKYFDIKKSISKTIIDTNLPDLLKAGLIYRGHPLKCQNCGLKDWYKLDRVDEFIECIGCATLFQLEELKTLEFSYKSNELAARFLNSGGPAILSTAVFLSQLESSGDIQLGGEISRPGEKSPFAEIDLFVFLKSFLVISECKSCQLLDLGKVNEIIDHLKKLVDTAILIHAKVIILSIVAMEVNADADLFSLFSTIQEIASNKGLGIHLLLNDEFYGFGKQEMKIEKFRRLSIEELMVSEELDHLPSIISVGEDVKQYSWKDEDKLFDRDLLECWKKEFCL